MIKKAESIYDLDRFDRKDIYSLRIKSLLCAYGCKYDFVSFYRQINHDKVTAVISVLDSDLTLSFDEDADKQELCEFFTVMGFSSLLCDDSFVMPFEFEQGIVMETDRKIEKHIPYCEIDNYPKLMELFNLTDYDKIDFESWYVDISHRIRRGCAKAVTLSVNSQIVSSAVFSAIYKNDAVLTAVKAQPEFRRMGYGSALVSEMINDISGKVYLMREKDKNEKFYKKLGFVNTGKWRIYK